MKQGLKRAVLNTLSMKCAICGADITETFLGKIRGTYFKGKSICPKCQVDLGIKEIGERLGVKK